MDKSSSSPATCPAECQRFSLRSLFFLTALVGMVVLPVYYFGEAGVPVSMILAVIAATALFLSVRLALCIALGLALLFSIIALPRGGSGPPSRRGICSTNLYQIEIALYQYHEAYGRFPPPVVTDAQGKPMHSWRVLILPFIEEQALYDQYDFSQPWDSPANLKVAAQMPKVFHCPSDPTARSQGLTSYLAVVGPDGNWLREQIRAADEVSQSSDKMLLLLEAPTLETLWTKPSDVSYEALLAEAQATGGPVLHSHHRGGCNAGFDDGHTSFLLDPLSLTKLREMMSNPVRTSAAKVDE